MKRKIVTMLLAMGMTCTLFLSELQIAEARTVNEESAETKAGGNAAEMTLEGPKESFALTVETEGLTAREKFSPSSAPASPQDKRGIMNRQMPSIMMMLSFLRILL